jgi:TPR repeat protein
MTRAALLALVLACSKPSPPKLCADVAACKADCDRHDARACEQLGKLDLRAKPIDLAGAAAAYRAACEAGKASSCAALALQVQDGRGVPWDPARAIELYQRACDGGAGVGCFNLAIMYNDGNGVPRDRAKAESLMARALADYEKECDADPFWCVNIGFLYENGMVGSDGPDLAKAAAADRRGCDRNDPASCASLSQLELDGRGVPQNKEAATARLERVCAGGGSLACAVLGRSLYTDPEQVPPRAAELILKGCDLGDTQSCAIACALLALGRGVAADPARAGEYGLRACDLGNSASCYANGMAMLESRPADAAEQFLLACHIGDPDGCLARADMITRGQLAGTIADTEELLERACSLGSQQGCARAHIQGH